MVIDGTASLSIKSLTHTAAAVTKVLGIEPTATAERGDPVGRVRTGADGKPSMRERTHSVWVLDAPLANEDTPFATVHGLVAVLEGKRDALDTLRANYFTEITWNGFSDRLQAGFLMPAELLASITALGCDFHGAIYLREGGADAAPARPARADEVAAVHENVTEVADAVDAPDPIEPATSEVPDDAGDASEVHDASAAEPSHPEHGDPVEHAEQDAAQPDSPHPDSPHPDSTHPAGAEPAGADPEEAQPEALPTAPPVAEQVGNPVVIPDARPSRGPVSARDHVATQSRAHVTERAAE